MQIEAQRPLLLGIDQFPQPINRPSSSRVVWGKRIVCTVAAVGSLALRVANLSRWTNAIGCLGAGISTLAGVTVGSDPEKLARIRQIALPLVGQISIFALSQAWANDPAPSHQQAFVSTIIALFGANIQIILGWLSQQGAIRTEGDSQNLLETGDDKTLVHFSRAQENLVHLLKIASAAGLGALAFTSRDSIVKSMATYFFPFLLNQVAGERLIGFLDHKILTTDLGRGSRIRLVKTALATLSYVGQLVSFAFMQWRKETIVDLVASATLQGLGDGIIERCVGRRIENLPVRLLEELKKLPPPKKAWQNIAYRVWKVSVPLIAITGIIGFTIWQNNYVLENKESKIALGSMLAGFLSGTTSSYLIDFSWDPNKRKKIPDQLMTWLWFSPRILGIDLLWFYYALINSIKIDANVIDEQTNSSRLTAIFFAWFFYGARMGHELVISSSSRIKSPHNFNKLGTFNGAQALSYYLIGGN